MPQNNTRSPGAIKSGTVPPTAASTSARVGRGASLPLLTSTFVKRTQPVSSRGPCLLRDLLVGGRATSGLPVPVVQQRPLGQHLELIEHDTEEGGRRDREHRAAEYRARDGSRRPNHGCGRSGRHRGRTDRRGATDVQATPPYP